MSNSSTENNNTGPFSMDCGTFEQLEYWPNNFDDFAVSYTEVSASHDTFADHSHSNRFMTNRFLTSSQNAKMSTYDEELVNGFDQNNLGL